MTFALLDPSDLCYAVSSTQPDAGKWVLIPPGTGDPVGKRWIGWEFQAPRWTSYEFLRRFTVQERASIRTASASDGAVADLMMFLQTATEVVSDDLTTSVGLDYLVYLGIITEARKAELLTP